MRRRKSHRRAWRIACRIDMVLCRTRYMHREMCAALHYTHSHTRSPISSSNSPVWLLMNPIRSLCDGSKSDGRTHNAEGGGTASGSLPCCAAPPPSPRSRRGGGLTLFKCVAPAPPVPWADREPRAANAFCRSGVNGDRASPIGAGGGVLASGAGRRAMRVVAAGCCGTAGGVIITDAGAAPLCGPGAADGDVPMDAALARDSVVPPAGCWVALVVALCVGTMPTPTPPPTSSGWCAAGAAIGISIYYDASGVELQSRAL